MSAKHSEHVYFLEKCPQAFLETFYPAQQGESQADYTEPAGSLEHRAGIAQAERWQQATGEAPGQSRFSVLYPVHNESIFLPSVLANLMMSDVPAAAHAHFIFISNGCTDDKMTEKILNSFLNGLGETELHTLPDGVLATDYGLAPTFRSVRLNNSRFSHISTTTPGRANALNIGNEYVGLSDDMAMCFDADVFTEPDTIRKLYAASRGTVDLAAAATPIVTGDSVIVYSRYRDKLAKGFREERRPRVRSIPAHHVSGDCSAWNIEFMHTIGGMPTVAIEDYALGLLAIARGQKIAFHDDIRVWGYPDATAKAVFNVKARYARGELQTVERYPELAELASRSFGSLRPLHERIAKTFEGISRYPARFHRYVGLLVLSEVARFVGRREYRRGNTGMTWVRNEYDHV